jgi:hypothetical protein
MDISEHYEADRGFSQCVRPLSFLAISFPRNPAGWPLCQVLWHSWVQVEWAWLVQVLLRASDPVRGGQPALCLDTAPAPGQTDWSMNPGSATSQAMRPWAPLKCDKT